MYSTDMDWIPITLKFRGKCIECGKELTSGQALWSKSTKSIKHIECSQEKADQGTSISTRESTTRRQEIKVKRTMIQKCFICDKWVNDEYAPFRYPNFIENKSHSYVCQSCIQDENAFENYRQSFLQKIKKLK
jgi:hypothetical protein